MELSLSWKKGTQRTFRRMLRILNDGSSTNRAEAAISKVFGAAFFKKRQSLTEHKYRLRNLRGGEKETKLRRGSRAYGTNGDAV
ncbi:hypothetical protein [Millionella massiliensis]|uniref:hypothetical protein n=2 Tax=Millionella massiliensis TaxID=1871023 RepID=UPI0024B8024C|nr:hypothetical protein [Millionella massiliensis]